MVTRVPSYSLWFAVSLAVGAALLWKPLERDRARIRTVFGLLGLWFAFALFAGLATNWAAQAKVAGLIAGTLLILAAIQVGFLLIVDIALRRVRLPKFASEIAIVAANAAALFRLLNQLGVDATGIFATSAVATAVVGLALQDMLSNIAGGMALQLEDSMDAGDYIRCGDQAGYVQHIRLRHTAILTVEGDSVILPNSLLTRSPVVIVSKVRRHSIHFAMPYSRQPQETIDALEHALRSSPIPGVLAEPKPECLIREMTPGYIGYMAVVWLSSRGDDDRPVSAVLNRIYYALDRAGIPASEISYLVETRAAAVPVEEASPGDILRRTPIFRLLGDADLANVATGMRRLSFGPGEHILRQGDPGDSMYFVVAGRVGITFRSADGAEKQVAQFESGEFFGEASLLTGEPRTATATANSRVTCYRLDKTALQHVMEQQPDLAEDMSVIMAHRQIELSAAREKLDQETALRREAESQTQMLARIRRFFGISGTSAAG
jgi:CRP-like cAMP-binding protein/small-conductance mechanosensitive channel